MKPYKLTQEGQASKEFYESQEATIQTQKVVIDDLAKLVANIAARIDAADLPNRITFTYTLTNWRKLSTLVADIIILIKNYKNGIKSTGKLLG